jgi:hypothetical protein
VTNPRGQLLHHYPKRDEGEWHAVTKVVIANGIEKLTKNDNHDGRALMKQLCEPNFTRS